MEDNRPEIEPDCFSSRELPADGDIQPFMDEMKSVWGDQVELARFTVVNDDYPNEPYPNGLYFEGGRSHPNIITHREKRPHSTFLWLPADAH